MTRKQVTVYECDACTQRRWSEVLPAGWWERADGGAHLCNGCEAVATKAAAVSWGTGTNEALDL